QVALVDNSGAIIEVNESWQEQNNKAVCCRETVGYNYFSNLSETVKCDQFIGQGLKAVLANELEEYVYEYSLDQQPDTVWYRTTVARLKVGAHAGAVVMHMDISEIRKMEAERLQQQEALQRRLTQAILQGQEKERGHIAQELHDNINQILAGTRMYLSIGANKDKAVKEAVQYPLELLDKSIEEIRKLSRNMVTPMEDIPLREMIADLLAMIKEGGTEVIYSYEIEGNPLPDELKLNLYRILQELSQNMIKYAAARQVTVSIGIENNELKLSWCDNGRGFETAKKKPGIGLANMKSRVKGFGGTVKIDSVPGEGTSTLIAIPL
ncbi:MAG: sensor histidine kinase, partial [Chitinophagaceae bacterium]